MSARVVFIDIETSPNVGYTWGMHEQEVIEFVEEWQLLCFAYAEGDGEVVVRARPDFSGERALVKAAWAVLDGADILIGHNIDDFDNRMLKAKFLEYNLPPPSPYRTVDTRKIARSQFRFNSNKLDLLAKKLKVGGKVKTGGFELWKRCMAGDPEAWETMKEYNANDVVIQRAVYLKMRPWAPTHPNLALYDGRPGCPACGGAKVHKAGIKVLKSRVAQQYHCQTKGCGHWFTGKVLHA